MARMIDGDKLMELFKEQYLCNKFMKHREEARAWQGAIQLLYDMPTLTQPNEPLTLDDLRKIDTATPLWVHNLSWGRHKPRLMLVRYVASRYWSCVDFDGFEIVKADDYGSRYLIYRRPPEGEEEEKHVIEITENL